MKGKKSKKLICAAVAATLALGVVFSGCSLITADGEEDMKQTVATVNITKSDKLDENLAQYSSAIGDETIVKRDLVNAFVNVGSNYINSGLSYADTFNTLLDELTNNAVLVQYATLYLLDDMAATAGKDSVLAEYKAKTTQKDKLIYLLGGEDSEEALTAQYNLYKSLNDALDSYEVTDDDDDEDYVGTDTRTIPGGIDTTVDDYIPKTEAGGLDYNVYTGYEGYLIGDAGTYEGKDKSNRNTRRQAYARFIKNIEQNYLLTDDDKELTDILSLSYVQTQYVNQLEQEAVNKLYDMFTEEQEAKISIVENGEYSYVKNAYEGLLGEQEQTNSKASTFESSMGSMSDTSFLLYAPDTTGDTENKGGTYGTFGYVYNILLPFSVTQNAELTKMQSFRDNHKDYTDSDYFAERNKLLKAITTTDQRSAWFNGQTDYSFDAAKYNEENAEKKIEFYNDGEAERNYLFFENNLTKSDEYKPLEKYIGKYSYNGKVLPNKDGSYTLVPKKLDIDGMIEEFSAYIDYVLGTSSVTCYAGDDYAAASTDYSAYYDITDFTKDGDEKEIDYSKLVYATGKVDIGNISREDMFVADSVRYKAMAAVNELQYAYTTDTGVLSQYIGYNVSAYETSYIKEFEYAAHEALRMGVGAFKVCAGDYGWHLIYVTEAFDFRGGEVYSANFTKERVEKEGTFENMFFEWIKDQTLTNESTRKRTEILQYFATESTVKKNEKAYKDLLEVG